MHVVIGIVGAALLPLLFAEFFVVFLLPRRVKRDPAFARGLLRIMWIPWRVLATRLPDAAADTLLGVFGPLGLLAILALLSCGLVACFAALYWAFFTHLGTPHPSGFGEDLYFSAGAFVSASATSLPTAAAGKVLQVMEAANGLAFLAIAIGYLPALFQAFSRRETAVALLDPRAGSPPSVSALLQRSSMYGGWRELDAYLHEWEAWTAELMETHLSYPILGYFRSQHVKQNWLAALVTIVDTCAYAIAYGPEEAIEAAELTFRIGRHALADLAYAFNARRVERDREVNDSQRLTDDELSELRAQLESGGLHSQDSEESRQRLEELRESYEPYAIAIGRQLALGLPDWLPEGEIHEQWRLATEHPPRDRSLP